MKSVGGRSAERLETERILALPTKGWPDAESLEIESFERLQVEAFSSGIRLTQAQAAGMIDWRMVRGGLFPCGVGSGKAGLGLMMAKDALVTGLCKKVMLLVPANLVISMAKSHIPIWRTWAGLPFNIHYFAGKSQAHRLMLAKSNAPGLYIMPYSLLSRPDTVEVLNNLDPGLVIADEAHNLKNLKTPRTKRLMDWMKSKDPRPYLVAMSGSITKRSLMDFHHLADAALGEGSPLPRSASMAYSWSLVLDSGADPVPGLTQSTLLPLMRWAGEFGDDGPRKAFQKRFRSTPGIVATADERPDSSLLIEEAPCGEPSEKLKQLMKKVDDGETPEGEPIEHAIHGYKWLNELSAGFFLSYKWPQPDVYAKNHRVTLEEAVDRIERAKLHHMAEKEYHRELRDYFKDPDPGIDTPFLVGNAISRGQIGGMLAELWHAAKDLKFPGMPERQSIPVRVCDHKVRAALSWAKSLKSGGIIWVYHREMGIWIYETLKDFGIDAVHCPAEAADLIESIGDPARGGKGDKVCVASITSHGTGRNLQAFNRQLFVQFPRGCVEAEQTLGRLHRNGQKADEVIAETLMSTEFDRINRAACLSDAVYAQQLTGLPQRVIYADYNPLPTIYPPEFLRERGALPEDLGAEARELIQSRFGRYTRKGSQ